MKMCPCCGNMTKVVDFYGKENCYKCTYQHKSKKKQNGCKICGGSVVFPKLKFCSDECSNKFSNEKRKNYWFKLIPKSEGNFNTKFSYRQPEVF